MLSYDILVFPSILWLTKVHVQYMNQQLTQKTQTTSTAYWLYKVKSYIIS